MSSWPSATARRVFAALKRIGWRHDRTVGSHKIMKKDGWMVGLEGVKQIV